MHMISSFLVVLSASLVAAVALANDELPNRPNIVLIMADDLGYQDVGFRGSDILTPNIDSLARDGVVLENHYVMPQCSPTRASLMSGRHAIRTGFWNGNIKPEEEWGLRLNETTMAEMLRRNGYKTHGVGKWHCGMYTWDHTPINRGFDSFFGLYLGSQDYFNHDRMKTVDFRSDYRTPNGTAVDEIRADLKGSYNTDVFTKRAVSVISSHDPTDPLFLYLSYTAPHSPYQAKKSDLAVYSSHLETSSSHNKRKLYSTMVSVMDRGVGEVVNALQQRNLLENTIIVFLSDNGAFFGGPGSNYPLRGGKQGLHEGGVRSVAVVNSPLLRVTGYVNTNLHHVSDWYPTFQALAGDAPEQAEKPQLVLDGVNIWESVSQNKSSGRTEVLINMKLSDKMWSNRRNDAKHRIQLSDGIPQFKPKRVKMASGGKTRFGKRVRNPIDTRRRPRFEQSLYSSANEISDTHYQHHNSQRLFNERVDLFVLRSGKWKLLAGKYLKQEWTFRNSIRSPPTKSSSSGKDSHSHGIKLFDLESDPREVMNVAPAHPDIVWQLLDKMEGYAAQMTTIERRGSNTTAGRRHGVWYPWVPSKLETQPVLML